MPRTGEMEKRPQRDTFTVTSDDGAVIEIMEDAMLGRVWLVHGHWSPWGIQSMRYTVAGREIEPEPDGSFFIGGRRFVRS